MASLDVLTYNKSVEWLKNYHSKCSCLISLSIPYGCEQRSKLELQSLCSNNPKTIESSRLLLEYIPEIVPDNGVVLFSDGEHVFSYYPEEMCNYFLDVDSKFRLT